MKKTFTTQKGFTLVEIIVSVALFAIVMTIATGAIFTIVNANRKAQSLNSVVSNLNFTIESMLRDLRTGYTYDCGITSADFSAPQPNDCPTTAQNSILFINSDGVSTSYELSGGAILKQVDILGANVPITAPEVTITDLKFYVKGADAVANPLLQPKIFIRISGYAGLDKTKSNFDIQTTVSQRVLNVQ